MGQIYHRLYYHLIWRTYLSQPIITTEIEKVLYPFLKNKAKRFKCHICEANGMEDHVHVAMMMPPSVAVSDIIGKLKGSSSYFLNREIQITTNFSWQDGFGALSFAERDLQAILAYIRDQKEYHRQNRLNRGLEKSDSEDQGVIAIT